MDAESVIFNDSFTTVSLYTALSAHLSWLSRVTWDIEGYGLNWFSAVAAGSQFASFSKHKLHHLKKEDNAERPFKAEMQ